MTAEIQTRTSIHNAGGVGNNCTHMLSQPRANMRVNVLCLLRRCCKASANGPYRLIGYHHSRPVRNMSCRSSN